MYKTKHHSTHTQNTVNVHIQEISKLNELRVTQSRPTATKIPFIIEYLWENYSSFPPS